jgi:hypothetical protein
VLVWLVLGPGQRLAREADFRRGRLNRRHLAELRYKQRLESLGPDDVRRFAASARDTAVISYLQRLLVFVEQASAWRQAPEGVRENVTFVMGEDRTIDNRFYEAATDYFAAGGQSGRIERNLRSLDDVWNYLRFHRPQNGLPWGVVNLVAHSYEWGGLSVPVRAGEGRTDAVALRQAMASGDLAPLPDGVVDCRTELRIQGCALGRDGLFLHLFSLALGGQDIQRPLVSSCRYLVNYESEAGAGARQFFGEYWYVVYPKGRRPSNLELARRLGERYPGVAIDWRSALGRTEPRRPGDSYVKTLNLPANWLTVYADSGERPRLERARDHREWLLSQQELADRLSGLGLGLDDFTWTMKDTTVSEHDTLRPGIVAVGRGSLACVRRDMMMPEPARPWVARRVYAGADPEMFSSTEIPAAPPVLPPGENVPFR